MESPDQTLVHLNSHGSSAIGAVLINNRFTNMTISPIKNISKIGLQYCAIPRTMDALNSTNCAFLLLIRTDAALYEEEC